MYILVFVDDLLISCKNENEMIKIKNSLMRKFIMKDLGQIKGIYVNYDREKNTMMLSQERYIESLAEQYNLIDAKLYETPMETNLRLTPSECADFNVKY